VLRDADYRQENPTKVNVVIHWPKNLSKDRDECWFLFTDLKATAGQLCALYRKRMTIEELFRDQKNRRNGWSLRDTQITKADRINRLLLILALAYWLLVGIGLRAHKQYRPGEWCSSNCDYACSVFFIGRKMQEKIQLLPEQAFAEVLDAILKAFPKWG
jgi:hypothetical protein